jgi:tRNA modification GTPase
LCPNVLLLNVIGAFPVRADTIAAPATPPGEGGIAVIRVSGPDAIAAMMPLFVRRPRDRRVVVGRILDPATTEVVDEAICILMRGPRSFTREDVVELHLHGGAVTVERVLGLLFARGVRPAEPGEFTLRAFLNGRIDLAQAESVLDLVRARTEAARRVAIAGLRGRVSEPVRAVRERLLGVLAYLVARLDFPEEDVPETDIGPDLACAAAEIERLLAGARAGALYRDGARVALVGPPNAGKSSLLNRLLRADRAIVTPVAGTTRDTLEETADINGIPVVLTDTAGLAAEPDPIEALGIERTRRAAAAADALLLVLDGAAPPPLDLPDMLALGEGRPLLVALNKCDLPPAFTPEGIAAPCLWVSAARGDGLDALEDELARLLSPAALGAGEVVVANPRHAEALRRARAAVDSARTGLAGSLPEDFISIDVRAAVEALGEITGESAGEELLDAIFSRFCIGK